MNSTRYRRTALTVLLSVAAVSLPFGISGVFAAGPAVVEFFDDFGGPKRRGGKHGQQDRDYQGISHVNRLRSRGRLTRHNGENGRSLQGGGQDSRAT